MPHNKYKTYATGNLQKKMIKFYGVKTKTKEFVFMFGVIGDE